MAKNNSNGNDAGAAPEAPAFIPTIHLILQGKGGVGKSVVASWLAEFLIGRGQPVLHRWRSRESRKSRPSTSRN
jgi:hypothetical protein